MRRRCGRPRRRWRPSAAPACPTSLRLHQRVEALLEPLSDESQVRTAHWRLDPPITGAHWHTLARLSRAAMPQIGDVQRVYPPLVLGENLMSRPWALGLGPWAAAPSLGPFPAVCGICAWSVQVLQRFEGFPAKKLEMVRMAAAYHGRMQALAQQLGALGGVLGARVLCCGRDPARREAPRESGCRVRGNAVTGVKAPRNGPCAGAPCLHSGSLAAAMAVGFA